MNKKEIEYILRNYHWMMNEIVRLGELTGYKGGATAMYGIEATLPKAKGMNSDPVYLEVARKKSLIAKREELSVKVLFVQQRMHIITNEQERTVLDCLLDGLTISSTARHMGLSERHIYKIRDSIVEKMLKEEECKCG